MYTGILKTNCHRLGYVQGTMSIKFRKLYGCNILNLLSHQSSDASLVTVTLELCLNAPQRRHEDRNRVCMQHKVLSQNIIPETVS